MPDKQRENRLKKYFAAKEAAERLLDEIDADLRSDGEKFIAGLKEVGEAFGEQYPAGTTEFDTAWRNGKLLRVSGVWVRRGCSDKESCDLPWGFAIGTDDERAALLKGFDHRRAAKAAAAKRAEEAAARKQLAALKERFGDE